MVKRFLIVMALALLGVASYYALDRGMVKWPLALRQDVAAKATLRPDDRSQRRPVPVEVANAEPAVSTMEILAIGSLASDESVEVTSEAAGRVKEILFEEGNAVKKGDVLVRLDDALAVAEVKDAEARLGLAQTTYDRSRSLQKSGAATKQSYDEAATNLRVAQAAVDLAQTRAAMMQVNAPFDGILGFRTISVGAYVTAGTKLVNLEKIDKLKVEFSVPEVFLAQLSTGQKIEVTVDAWPGEVYEGTVYAINPHIDVNGRALQVRASLVNAGMKLRPGLLARVTLKGKDERQVVAIPESAIVPRGGETFVYRLENGRAIETPVVVGRRRNGIVEILKGLAPNAQVVTAGHARLKDGNEVEVVTAESGASG
jgi:membrane fusion protein (multidrug efflux system)